MYAHFWGEYCHLVDTLNKVQSQTEDKDDLYSIRMWSESYVYIYSMLGLLHMPICMYNLLDGTSFYSLNI